MNQEEQLTQAVLGAQEAAVDDELEAYDALLDDMEAMNKLRAKRLAQMKEAHAEQQRFRELGHGGYQELGESGGNVSVDIAKAFFAAAKESDRMIVHFYRPSTRHCDVFHRHLSDLAPKHLETRFFKLNVDGVEDGTNVGAKFLVERLGITVMPTLALVKNRKVIHRIQGFDELGNTANVSRIVLKYVLGGVYGMLDTGGGEDGGDVEEPEELAESRKNGHVNTIKTTRIFKQQPSEEEEY